MSYIIDFQRVFITFTDGFPETEIGASHLRQNALKNGFVFTILKILSGKCRANDKKKKSTD